MKLFLGLLLLSNSVVTRESFRKILSRKSGLSNHRKKMRTETLKIDPELSMTTVSLVHIFVFITLNSSNIEKLQLHFK